VFWCIVTRTIRRPAPRGYSWLSNRDQDSVQGSTRSFVPIPRIGEFRSRRLRRRFVRGTHSVDGNAQTLQGAVGPKLRVAEATGEQAFKRVSEKGTASLAAVGSCDHFLLSVTVFAVGNQCVGSNGMWSVAPVSVSTWATQRRNVLPSGDRIHGSPLSS
jgi:hypothetical protein